MTRSEHWSLVVRTRLTGIASLLILMVTFSGMPAYSQTYSVILDFFGTGRGAPQVPLAGVTIDPAGNLYGTTAGLFGTVYELRNAHSSWTFNVLDAMPADGQQGLLPDSRAIRVPMAFCTAQPTRVEEVAPAVLFSSYSLRQLLLPLRSLPGRKP